MTESSKGHRFVAEPGEDFARAPVRLLVVQGEERPPVDVTDEPMVMTFPHLLVRELIAFLGLTLVLVVVSLLFDAPLEEIANPEKTPNPAKAPWYFLGLQELLHYYPPVISGVLLPALVVLALIIIPYFHVNVARNPFVEGGSRRRKLFGLWIAVALLSLLFATTAAHPVWPIIIPLWGVALLATLPFFSASRTGLMGTLARRSLPFWIYFAFLVVAITLTLIGVFFRGPGWAFTLPWREGIF